MAAPVTQPEKLLADWGIALSLFIFSCLYLSVFYNYATLFSDEGIVLQGAQRILQGQVLYRDFFAFITPGSYYWMALLFKVFGSSILVARTALVIYGTLFSVLTYLISRRVCSRWISSIAASLVTVTCLPYYFLVVHNWDSTLWAYFAIYCSVRLLESRRWMWAASVGSFAAFTCLSEQSKGGGLVLGIALGLALVSWGRNHSASTDSFQWEALVVGFAWPFATTFAYFGFKHGLVQMLAAWFWPLQHYSAANKAFYGQAELTLRDIQSLLAAPWAHRVIAAFALAPCFIVPALPWVAMGILAMGFHRLLRGGGPQEASRYYVLVSAILTCLLLSTLGTGRPDLIHIMFQAPMFLLVVAWALGGRDLPSPRFKAAGQLAKVLVVVSFAAFGVALLWAPLNARHRLETRRGVLMTAGPDGALEKLQSQLKSGAHVFIYPNQPLYYYLTATNNPAAFDVLSPGLTTPAQSEAAFQEIQADRTSVVLFEANYVEKLPESRSSMPLSVLAARDFGIEYILAHYKVCQTLKSALQQSVFVFTVRKDLSCGGPF